MADVEAVKVGDTARDFNLRDTTGALRQLSEFTRESLVVVIVYRGHW